MDRASFLGSLLAMVLAPLRKDPTFSQKLDALRDMGAEELQLTIIYRAGYHPPDGKRWMIGLRHATGGGNGEWSTPFGFRFGKTMEEAVEAFYEHSKKFIGR